MSDLARSFRDLRVWQKAHGLVLEVYRATAGFPKEEIYGLTSQFRRAEVSVPANIAEGFDKRSEVDKLRFLNIAQGSLEECRYYVVLASDLGYFVGDVGQMDVLMTEVSRLLNAYMEGIRRRM